MNKALSEAAKLMVVLAYLSILEGCASRPATTVAKVFQEGGYYQTFNPVLPVATTDGRIEVVEVFFYACPHCNALEPKIKNWLKDKQGQIDFKRVPAIMGAAFVDQAKAYYVAESLGVLDRIHPALLKSIHDEGKQYYNEYAVLEFFMAQGISRQDFIKAYNSPEVAEKVSQARVLSARYALRGVPALIINGRYKTAQYFTGTQEKMLAVADSLIALEQQRIAVGNGTGQH
ncbi:MAG: disulfide bond formation protein DsbA [Gammaproteobacteria bacterium HGW-Gammaproteobacteria-3]|nr:MAG: disulfide bond formation protein DsbA [Gammaproteobacteria bacterium HGW-Gammaproteobacteria-3]